MNRLTVLVKKELKQHYIYFIILAGLMAAAFGMMLLGAMVSKRTLSLLTSESVFLYIFIPLGAIVLGNRLVVKEYYGRTQLFIEALPISRIEMVLVKYGFGLIFLLSVNLITLCIALLFMVSSDPVSIRFFCILVLRSTIFCYCVWSFLFAMGFTGKFRIPIYIFIGMGIVMIASMTDFDLLRSSPISLVAPDDFPLERYDFPVKAFINTLILGTLCLAVALILALIHEGSVAEILAKPMNQREKATIGVLVISFVLAAALMDGKREKKPYAFKSKSVIVSKSAPIEILYIHKWMKPNAMILIHKMEDSVVELTNVLGLKKMPPIRLAYRDSLDTDKFETAELERNDGILMRANFSGMSDWDYDPFEAYLIRAILDHTMQFRSRYDPKRWIHDGFSCWWAHDGFRMDSDAHKTLILRSMVAIKERPLTPEVVKNWSVFREKCGEPYAEAVAYSILVFLEEQYGREKVITLSKSILGRLPPMDFREVIYESDHPMPVIFEKTIGVRWEIFLSHWDKWLREMANLQEFSNALEAIGEVSGNVSIEVKQGMVRNIVYEFKFTKIPDAGIVCALLHKKLPPFDSAISATEVLREEIIVKDTVSHTQSGRLEGRYNSGDRVFLALEFDSDILGAPVRIYAQRMNLQ